ncbi:extracellular solute-binding protein [Candidatus Peregrinibacteria bacterium]|nr:extracellular solute-binding protein [Candidatus Peregrinibacteria bacterium]
MLKKSSIALLIFLLATLPLAGCLRKKVVPVTLTFYGLDNSDVFEPLIRSYHEKFPQVTVKYKKFGDPQVFENLVVDEIAEGEGPDVFYLSSSALPRHAKKLAPLNAEMFSAKNFGDVFVEASAGDFLQPDPADGNVKIYAFPLFVDPLVLYYNKTVFEQKVPERGRPARTWDLFKQDAEKIREEESGALVRGAIAIGRADNIMLAPDILLNFFLQYGVDFYDKDFQKVMLSGRGLPALQEFLSYADSQNKYWSWNKDMAPNGQPLQEVEAFLSGKTAAIFGYSDLYGDLANHIKNLKSRNLRTLDMKEVGIAPVPQLSTDESDFRVFERSYGLAVSRNSKNPQAAWNFIQYLTSAEALKSYHAKTKRPASRRDLVEEQRKEPVTEAALSQIGFAAGYHIYAEDRFIPILRKAVAEASEDGKTPSQVLRQAEADMNAILQIEAPGGLYPKPKVKKKS